jgi:hypothetical protein
MPKIQHGAGVATWLALVASVLLLPERGAFSFLGSLMARNIADDFLECEKVKHDTLDGDPCGLQLPLIVGSTFVIERRTLC